MDYLLDGQVYRCRHGYVHLSRRVAASCRGHATTAPEAKGHA